MRTKYRSGVLLGLVGAGVACGWSDFVAGAAVCFGLAIVLWFVPTPGEDVGPEGRATDFFTAANDEPQGLRDDTGRKR